MRIDLAHDAAGISDGDNIGGDVFCHDASCTDHRIISDCNARHDNCACADLYISFNKSTLFWDSDGFVRL